MSEPTSVADATVLVLDAAGRWMNQNEGVPRQVAVRVPATDVQAHRLFSLVDFDPGRFWGASYRVEPDYSEDSVCRIEVSGQEVRV